MTQLLVLCGVMLYLVAAGFVGCHLSSKFSSDPGNEPGIFFGAIFWPLSGSVALGIWLYGELIATATTAGWLRRLVPLGFTAVVTLLLAGLLTKVALSTRPVQHWLLEYISAQLPEEHTPTSASEDLAELRRRIRTKDWND